MLTADEGAETSSTPLRVFVHLAHSFGCASWKERWSAGKIAGINHEDPYGYQQANAMGVIIAQSEDYDEGHVGRLFRLGLRAVLGFDLVHAWRNRRGIFAAEVVWTHTESQALAILLLMQFSRAPRPKLIAQSVWLVDNWEGYAAWKRWLYRKLLPQADILTFHSPLALQKAEELLPRRPKQIVRYGIRADQTFTPQGNRDLHTPMHLVMIGNDRDRDWPTFIKAFANDPRYQARLITKTDLSEPLSGVDNMTRERLSSNEELFALYSWADLVVVCLKPNLHASGITVLQEAVLCGVPIICTDAGGLEIYFDESEITYVPVGEAQAVRSAAEFLMNNEELRTAKVSRALRKMQSGNVNSYSFVAEHVAISRRLVGR